MAGSSGKSRLSVAVIVRDAADLLRLTLASASRIADEIVVVDTGSSDRTTEVAREFKAQVFDFPWSDDFSAARNFATSHITGDWVLWLDAGESLSEKDGKALKDFVIEAADANSAYCFIVQVSGNGFESDKQQVARIRLVPHRPGIAFVSRVREKLAPSLASLNMQLNALPMVISRGRDIEEDTRRKKRRAQRNMRLAELEQRERGTTADSLNCMGEAFQTLGHAEKAEACYRQAIQQAAGKSSEQLEAYYGMLTSLEQQAQVAGADECQDSNSKGARAADQPHQGLGAIATEMANMVRQTQLAVCMQALEAFPLDAQLLCALGGYLHHQGSTELAAKAYATAYEYGQIDPMLWHISDIHEMAGVCHAVSLRLLKREEDAIQFLEKATSENPNSIKLRRQLIDIYVGAGNRESALTHTSKLPKEMPHREAFRSAVRGASYAVDKNWIAAKAYLQTAYGHGCREPLCLRWLAITLIIGGEFDSARPILDMWRGLEPQNEECTRLLEKLAGRKDPSPTASVSERSLRIDAPASSLSGTAIPLNLGIPSRQ